MGSKHVNKYVYWLGCIFSAGFSTYLIMSWIQPPKALEVKIDTAVNYATHSLDEQLQWALCYVDLKSSDIRDSGQNFHCGDPKFAKNWFDVTVNEMHKSDLPEMKACAINRDLVNIVTVIGEAFFVNVTGPETLDITQENVLPKTVLQICKKVYHPNRQTGV